jgi:hypothetical protein
MTEPEVAQLELLAQIDELIARLADWAGDESPWRPANRAAALVRRLLSRVETLRVRLEAPLVVATFGGTGTGKSSLVNALVGQDCTATGRERPTTTVPVLLLHPQIEFAALGLNEEEFRIVRVDAPLLRDIVIIDCPDPDTNEAESPGSNLERLRHLLPHCDVLIYTSTQQKYRSARVLDELWQAATGCRLLFVQTHADLDEDIRDDWRAHLAEQYNVPDLFFVDSLAARRAQQAGLKPAGDFARLHDVLTRQLSQSQRVRIRRANLIDLTHAALQHCRNQLAGQWPAVEQLEAALEEERQKLTAAMTGQLGDELLAGRYLWERRLLGAVTENWGFSPFSSMLRLYNGLGSLIASMTLFRARSSVQVALLGVLQGARWLKSRQSEQEAELRLQGLSTLGLDDDLLRESQLVVAGYASSAQLDPGRADRASLDDMRTEAAQVEDRFLNDAGRRVDEVIGRLAARNSRLHVRLWYELLFLSYVGFVVFRVGKNFFYDTFLRQFLSGAPGAAEPLLPVDFYISAGVFFVLWSGLLVMAFTSRLRRGLTREVAELAGSWRSGECRGGCFPNWNAPAARSRCRGSVWNRWPTTRPSCAGTWPWRPSWDRRWLRAESRCACRRRGAERYPACETASGAGRRPTAGHGRDPRGNPACETASGPGRRRYLP